MKKSTILLCIAIYATATSAQTTGDYRTKASGNWTDYANVWQRYNGTNWVAATAYPGSSDKLITIEDGHTVTVNANITIDQTVVSAGAQLNLSSSSYTVLLNNGAGDDLTINGQMNWNAGVVSGSGSVKNNGNLQWTGGNLQSSLTNAGLVSLGYVYITSAVFTNTGTVNWFYNADVRFNGSTFQNNGVFNVYGTGTLYNYANGGTFNNNARGVFNVQVPGTVQNNIAFNNNGTIKFNSGTFYNYSGVFTNTKNMNFAGGTYLNRGTANLNGGSKITGNGFITLNSYAINFNAAINIPAGVELGIYGNSNLAGTGSINLNGNLVWFYGSISVPLTIENKGSANIYNANGYLYKSLTNNGVINWSGYNIKFYNGSIINNAQFNIYNDDALAPYNLTYNGSFVNNASGTLTKYAIGTTTISIPFTNRGTIEGVGAFAFGSNLTNTGTFAPGMSNATGILTTGTNYKNKVLHITMQGAQPGLEFDRLVVNGNLTLGNDTLIVTATGTLPAGAYTIVSCTGSRSGTFKVKELPAGYTVSYQTNKVIVNVPAALVNKSGTPVAQNTSAFNIQENHAGFTLYPNPARSYVVIHPNSDSALSNASMVIKDIAGRTCLTQKITNGSAQKVNLASLAKGVYLVSVVTNAGIQTRKLTVE